MHRLRVVLTVMLLVSSVLGAVLLISNTHAKNDFLNTLHLLYVGRVFVVLLVGFVFWNSLARWVAARWAMDASVLIKLKVRSLVWYVLFESVFLIGVIL